MANRGSRKVPQVATGNLLTVGLESDVPGGDVGADGRVTDPA